MSEEKRDRPITPQEERRREANKVYGALSALLWVYLPSLALAMVFVQERALLGTAMVMDIGLLLLLNGGWGAFCSYPCLLARAGQRRKPLGFLLFFAGAAILALGIYLLIRVL